jgi:hypothetical protein
MSFVSRVYDLTPARVRQIVEKSKQPNAPFGLSKYAIAAIRNALKIGSRPLNVEDVIMFVEQGHLHTRHPNFGPGGVDAISAALMAYRDDKTVMAYLVRSPGAFDYAMQLRKRKS